MPTTLVRPSPVLPASLRLTLWQRLDLEFALILAVVFLSHLGFVLYLRGIDWPRHPSIDELPDRIVRTVLRRPRAPLVPALTSALPKPSIKKVYPRVVRPVPQVDKRSALATQMRRTGLVALLTSIGDRGGLADLLSVGMADRDQATALRGVGGLTASTEISAPGDRIGIPSSQGRISQITDLRGGGAIAGAAVLSGPVERKVSPVVRHERPVIDGSGDPAAFSRDVKSRLSALRLCYERALKRDDKLTGRVVLRFTTQLRQAATGAASGAGRRIDFGKESFQ